jgi:muramoyltetrapeptide carboxypeptidase
VTSKAINLSRRQFTHALAASIVATAALTPDTAQARVQRASRATRHRQIKPPALRRGDLVALFNPSGFADDSLIQRATTNLEKQGLRVMHAAHLRASRGNTAGTIGQRVTDLHTLFANREVRALWAARGGSGAAQLLPYIDYGLVTRNPKIVIGYSDTTALLLALHAKSGLVTFHGPVASSGFTPFTVSQLEAILIEGRPDHAMVTAEEHRKRAQDEPHFVQRVLRSGSADGTLLGGNLSVLASLVGTPYLPDTRNALLFLEEISEAPYRIDRMLTQLEQSGALNDVRGAMLGVFVKCEPTANEESLVLPQALDDHFSARPIPSAYGLSFGHISSQWVLPIGIRARFNADARTLTLLESGVSGRR